MKTKQYTVILLFNADGSKILLQTKDRTSFAGMLNGVGGKIEEGESPYEGAIREMEEETTLSKFDVQNFSWLGTLTIPEQCDTENPDLNSELYFFGGIVTDKLKARKNPDSTELVKWYGIRKDNTVVSDLELAGNGDLPYFIESARKKLFYGNPVSVK